MSASFTSEHRGGYGEPMVCLHGFTDTWRTWELVLEDLERAHDVLAPTLAGHAGGPPTPDPLTVTSQAEEIERAMDAAGFATAHLVGNSLGGYLALQLAARGRARTVTALAPAGGWLADDTAPEETLKYFVTMRDLVQAAAPRADEIVSTPEGRRRATLFTTENFEHIPPELLAHAIRGAAACDTLPLLGFARRDRWQLDTGAIDCPVQIVWGTADKLLAWPSAAQRYRDELPDTDWVTLDGIGHCPQLDVPHRTAELVLGFANR